MSFDHSERSVWSLIEKSFENTWGEMYYLNLVGLKLLHLKFRRYHYVRSHVPNSVNVDKFNTLLIFCYVYFLYVPFRV